MQVYIRISQFRVVAAGFFWLSSTYSIFLFINFPNFMTCTPAITKYRYISTSVFELSIVCDLDSLDVPLRLDCSCCMEGTPASLLQRAQPDAEFARQSPIIKLRNFHFVAGYVKSLTNKAASGLGRLDVDILCVVIRLGTCTP